MARVRRRETPNHFEDYKRYKPFLQKDFRRRCCYCTIHECNWGNQGNFAVEHFKPKKKFPSLATTYSNLYYACNLCNSYKGEKWPLESDIEAGVRFFDPCVDLSSRHLTDDGLGILRGVTACGEYTWKSLRLNRPQLVQMRNTRRQLYARFRKVLREIRDLRNRRADLPPGPLADLLDSAINNEEFLLGQIRTRYFKPDAQS